MTNAACETIAVELPALAGGRLDPAIQSEVERHLRSCASCQVELEELRRLERILAEGLPEITPSPTFASSFANRLAAERIADEERAEAKRGFFSWRIRPWLIPLAAAATVAGLVLQNAFETPREPGTPMVAVAGPEVAPALESEPAPVPRAVAPAAPPVRVAAPPADLLERPELFVDFSVIRHLDTLESAEAAG